MAFNDRQRVMIDRLLDGFEGKITSSKWAQMTKCSQDTALRDIDDLIAKGVLKKDAAGGWSTSYSLAAASPAANATKIVISPSRNAAGKDLLRTTLFRSCKSWLILRTGATLS